MLRGEFDAIQVEPPGLAAEAAEFRLYGRHPDGSDEVHQCKRRHATSWTVLDIRNELMHFSTDPLTTEQLRTIDGLVNLLRTVDPRA